MVACLHLGWPGVLAPHWLHIRGVQAGDGLRRPRPRARPREVLRQVLGDVIAETAPAAGTPAATLVYHVPHIHIRFK